MCSVLMSVNDRKKKQELQIWTQLDFCDHIMDIVTPAEQQQERVHAIYYLHSWVFLRHNFFRRNGHLFCQDLHQFICGEVASHKIGLVISGDKWVVQRKLFNLFVAQHIFILILIP